MPGRVGGPYANALRAADGGSSRMPLALIALPPKSFAENQQGELREADYTNALAGPGGKPGQGYQAVRTALMRVRRLTPTECERLQGVPDGWTLPAGADSHRYARLGNMVTVNVARFVFTRIRAVDPLDAA